MPKYDFRNKVALVTAGASGIGEATARAFADAGAAVLVADVNEAAGAACAERLASAGARAAFFRADATREEDVVAMVEAAAGRFGRLDYAANVVGGMGGGDFPRNSVVGTTVEQWEGTMAANVRSTWLCLKHQVSHMLGHGGGSIVNIASLAAYVGRSDASAAYSVAKAAVIQLTRVAAAAYGPQGVRVNAVAPGLTGTAGVRQSLTPEQQIPKNHLIARMVEPEEIAAAILWLCSDASAMVTGQTLPVDGGWSAR
ncbi:MAG: SDR family NAD(P)-dependent oxidoreductase [Gammaproteobacteria bacterium]